MQYITEINAYENTKRAAVTLGKFDALHSGHQKLVDRICEHADEHTVSVVCAFDMGQKSLLTGEEKRKRLETRVDYLIDCLFTKELKEMEAEEFIREILFRRFHASYIAVGTDFRFGHGKDGDVSMLQRYAKEYGYCLDVIAKETYQGKIISSTYIREALSEGNVELANTLLHYPYSISAVVEHGKKLGRRLGFPTLNLNAGERKFLPKFGVYICRVRIDGIWYGGIANVGVKPTVTDEYRALTEVFAFGYEGDAYGKNVTAEFLRFLRPEMKFHSVEELKNRVEADIRYGREYFEQE